MEIKKKKKQKTKVEEVETVDVKGVLVYNTQNTLNITINFFLVIQRIIKCLKVIQCNSPIKYAYLIQNK